MSIKLGSEYWKYSYVIGGLLHGIEMSEKCLILSIFSVELSLKSGSHLPKKIVLCQWKPFKNDEKCFLFHLKRSFVLTFWSCRKSSLIRKKRLINFNIYDVTNWLTNKNYIARYRTKYWQPHHEICKIMENNMRNIFLQKSCRKWGRETSSRPLIVF